MFLSTIVSLASLVASVAAQAQTAPLPDVTVGRFPGGAVAGCKLVEGYDRPGFDLKNRLQRCTCWLKYFAAKRVAAPGVTTTNCVFDSTLRACNPYMNVDFVGNDIGHRTPASLNDCCDLCTQFPGCTAYAYSADANFTGTCWFKSGLGLAVAKPSVTSSSLQLLKGGVFVFEFDTDYPGNDIANYPAKDSSLCTSLCKNTTGCKAFTWTDYNSGTCWLKTSDNAVPKKGAVSAFNLAFYP